MKERPKQRVRQLALTEHRQETPHWETLPEDCRREVVALLAELLRSAACADEEMADE
jgi:hypothetical protein